MTSGRVFRVRVVDVVSGDSLKVVPASGGGVLDVHLHCIDAPDYRMGDFDASTRYLKSLAAGRYFYMENSGRDDYVRQVAVLYSQDPSRSLNWEMVASGWAHYYDLFHTLPGLREAQRSAESRGLGVWRPGGNPTPPWVLRGVRRRRSLDPGPGVVGHQHMTPQVRRGPSRRTSGGGPSESNEINWAVLLSIVVVILVVFFLLRSALG